MAGMFKLILLMTLAAICFLPQDGVDAAVQCFCSNVPENECIGEEGIKVRNCTSGKCFVTEFILVGSADDKRGKNRNCANKDDLVGKCKPVPEGSYKKGTHCVCDKDLCNSDLTKAGWKGKELDTPSGSDKDSASDRLQGWSSSVLNGMFVLVLVTTVPFLGRP